MNAAKRLLTAFADALRRPLLRRRLGKIVIERVRGVPLVVLPEVFNPVVFRTGRLLAEALADDRAAAQDRQSGAGAGRALDLGTGSGIGAIFAARAGYRVTAIDINPAAVRCARINALLNELEEQIEVSRGDLFGPVTGTRFDLVMFNPPFFRGEPVGPLDAAWRSADVLERFAAQLPAFLAPGGRALVVLSSHGEGAGLLRAMASNGLETRPLDTRDFGHEVLRVHEVRASGVATVAGELVAAGEALGR